MTYYLLTIALFTYIFTIVTIGNVSEAQNKESIPKSAEKITSDEEPKEYYQDLTSSYWDQADFWGRIYLPFDENDYMEFEVGA